MLSQVSQHGKKFDQEAANNLEMLGAAMPCVGKKSVGLTFKFAAIYASNVNICACKRLGDLHVRFLQPLAVTTPWSVKL